MSKCQNFYCNTCFPLGGLSYGPQCSPGALLATEVKAGQIWADEHGEFKVIRVSSDTVFYRAINKYDGKLLLSHWLDRAAKGYLWLVSGVVPQAPKVCDCGGTKARTTHSSWCSSAATL